MGIELVVAAQALLAPLFFLLFTALLLSLTSSRLGIVQVEFERISDQLGANCDAASDLRTRARRLRISLICLYGAAFLFTLASTTGAFAGPAFASQLWLVGAASAPGLVLTAIAMASLCREAVRCAGAIDSQLTQSLGDFESPKKKHDGPMRILFEFAGGPLDGKTVDGRIGDQGEAERFYLLTHGGRIGQRFKLASEYAIDILSQGSAGKEAARQVHKHVYVVTDRLEGENEVLVRAEYSPKG